MKFLEEKSRERPSQHLHSRKERKKRWRKIVSATLCTALLCTNMAWASADEQFMADSLPVEEENGQSISNIFSETDSENRLNSCTHVHTEDCDPALGKECLHVCTVESGCISEAQNPLIGSIIKQNEVTSKSHLDIEDDLLSTTITEWTWVDEDGFLVQFGDEWYLSLPGANREDLTEALLEDMLPDAIDVVLADGESQSLPITWDFSALNDEAEAEFYRFDAVIAGDYALADKVEPPYIILTYGGAEVYAATYPGSRRILTEAELNAALSGDDHKVPGMTPAGTTVNLFDYVASKDGAVTNDLTDKVYYNSVPAWVAKKAEWNKGINNNRLLIFGDSVIGAGYWNLGAGASRQWAKDNTNMKGIVMPNLTDGYPVINVAHAKDSLENVENYKEDQLPFCMRYAADEETITWWFKAAPALSTAVLENGSRDSSLAYLFDPEINLGENVKRTYKNVTGLFQMDDQGYYYYDARKNFAEFKEDKTGNATSKDGTKSDGSFVLYDGPAVWRTDSGWNSATGSFDGNKSLGNFYPFNTGRQVFDCIDNETGHLSSSEALDSGKWGQKADGQIVDIKNAATGDPVYLNHHMGMTMTVDFQQPENGQLNIRGSEEQIAADSVPKQDMVFQFSGDDDVWVFIDDVLVLDLGGIHSELYGTINFHTGEIIVGQSWRTGGLPSNPGEEDGDEVTTLYEMFAEALDDDEEELNNRFVEGKEGQKTFPTGTTHTLKLFYLERANYDSSLCMRFNLQPALYHNIKKVDQNGAPLEGVEFTLYPATKVNNNNQTKVNSGSNEDGDAVGEEDSADAKDYTIAGEAIGVLITGKDGTATFVKTEENNKTSPFSFSDRFHADGTQYYILKETKSGTGYRPMPNDIVLKFEPEHSMLKVVNRYQIGAYASFRSTIRETGKLTYGLFNVTDGWIAPDNSVAGTLQPDSKANGLVIAVPMLLQKEMSKAAESEGNEEDSGNDEDKGEEVKKGKWVALYGSNTAGYGAVVPEYRTPEEWRKAVLKAALYQCSDDRWPKWYLDYKDTGRLEGLLEDLPGRSDRYALVEGDNADMRMVYGIIEPYALEKLRFEDGTCVASYSDLERYVGGKIDKALEDNPIPDDVEPPINPEAHRKAIIEGVINNIYEDIYTAKKVPDAAEKTYQGRGFSFLNTDQFQREFRSIIYIPNEKRELRIWKVDDNGEGVEGATFTLYQGKEVSDGKNGKKIVMKIDENTKEPIAVTSGTTDQDGVLIFTPDPPNGNPEGYAKVKWGNAIDDNNYPCYVLQETGTPEGYAPNTTEIPVIVGYYSIYAGAGTPHDGVTVMSGVGKLMQAMVKYAADDMVNITLRDITAIAQVQDMNNFSLNGWREDKLNWSDEPRSMNLHYGRNALVDYGLHDEDGGKYMYPFFTTDVGFQRAKIIQNEDALNGTLYGDANNSANWDPLGDADLTSLFSQLNTVVITDPMLDLPETGKLRLSKTLFGNKNEASGQEEDALKEDDYAKNFTFKVELIGADDNGLSGEYYYYGEQRSGYIEHEGVLSLRHDDALTILGLPVGTKWRITEELSAEDKNTWQPSPPASADGVIERSGVIEQGRTDYAPFLNYKDNRQERGRGHLVVSKTVTGNAGNFEKMFDFKVTILDGKDENGNDKVNTTIDGRYGQMRFDKGVARFQLKHNGSIIAEGLPAGVSYKVEEIKGEGDDYVTSSVNETGEIIKDEIVEAAFTNKRDIEPPEEGHGNLVVAKSVDGKDGNKNKEFTFTVTLTPAIEGDHKGMIFNKNGVATFKLKHGESIIAYNLPVGVKYTVVEQEANQDDYVTTSTAEINGVITEDNTITHNNIIVNFVNEIDDTPVEDPKTGNLTVTKTVFGNQGDKNKEFAFKVTLDDLSISGKKGEMTFDGGVAAFTLKDGESKTASDLPVGVGYSVEEDQVTQEGYTTSSAGEKGEIAEKGSIAAFLNVKDDNPSDDPQKGNLTVTKTVSSDGDRSKEFTFTVTLGDTSIKGEYGEMTFVDGVAEFTLKHGQSKTASGLPIDVTYTVAEQKADQDGYDTSSVGESGTITASNIIVGFLNEKDDTPVDDPKTSNLKVTKTVSGNQGDKNKAFTFIVTLDKPIDGEYGEMDFTNGIAAFTLKHGESKTASGLPADIRYTVAEKEANQDGYTTSHTGETGTIASGETATAVFNNHKGGSGGGPGGPDPEEPPKNPEEPKTPVEPKEPKTPPEEPKEPEEPVITEEPKEDTPIIPDVTDNPDEPNSLAELSEPVTPTDNVPKTGDETRLTFWLILLTISGIGIIVALLSRRQQKQRGYRR